MRAFVLSGGGNRGPLELGAVEVLFEAGIVPDIIVGSSAGALNGLFLAMDPTIAQARLGAELWRDAGRRRLFTNSMLNTLASALRGKRYLADNARLRAHLREIAPPGMRTFGDLKIPLYVTIAHFITQTLYVYGDDHSADPYEAALQSAAVPGFFPPHDHKGELFVDGGVVSNLPVDVAIARGATEIWAIDIANQPGQERAIGVDNAFAMSNYCVANFLYLKTLRELEHAIHTPGVTLHHIPLYAHGNVRLGDFSQTDSMIGEGAAAARDYLAAPSPNAVRYPLRYQAHELPEGPPGAVPFVHLA
jgi:NTE family protein